MYPVIETRELFFMVSTVCSNEEHIPAIMQKSLIKPNAVISYFTQKEDRALFSMIGLIEIW